MKHYLSCCLSLLAATAGATMTSPAIDPSITAKVGAQRVAETCTIIDMPTGDIPPFSIGTSTMKAGSVTGSTANPELKPLATSGPDLTGLPGNKTAWVSSYSNYGVSSFSTSVSLVEGYTYKVDPFIYIDVSFTFTVDPESGTVSIPVQKVAESDGNIISICKVDLKSNVFSATDPLSGSVVDGNLFIEDAFGFFVTQGPLFGHYLNIGIMSQAVVGTSNTTFRNNAISFTDNVMNSANRKITTTDYPAFVYPVGSDRLHLLNVPVSSTSRGELTLTLTPSGSVVVNPQPATVVSLVGEFYFYKLTEITSADGTIKFSASPLSPIELTYDKTTRKLSMPCWGVARSTSLLAMNESSTFTLPFEPEFPTIPALDLEGQGTEQSPWLIKSAQDFVSLGIDILSNSSERGSRELIPGSSDEYYYPVYKGKYFKLANDIDFSSLDIAYTPVGSKEFEFAGNLDGAGFTIQNLEINNYAYDFCGLFSVLSTYSTVSNLKFDKAYITTLGYTVGVLAGYAHGAVRDITITDSKVLATAGYNAGILAGYTRNVNGVTITGSSVQAIGYVGGLCGRSYGDLTNCSVQGTVLMTGKQMFGGGIVGHQSKTYAEETNHNVSGCSFSGTVQCSADQIGLGGLAGGFSYATMDKCYANAVVIGASSMQAYLGGLAGTVFDATIRDCYVSGFIRNDASTTVGGLLGHVTESTAGADTSTMTGCYSSAMLASASTDAMRGIIGENTRIAITDTYYDAQIAAVENPDCGLSTSSLTSGEAIKGLSADKWDFTKGIYPRLKGSEDSPIAAVASAALILPDNETVKAVENDFTYSLNDDVTWKAVVDGMLTDKGGYAFTFDNGVGKLNYEQQTDTIFVQKGIASKYYIVNIAPVLFEGKGTAEEPWKISTKADLTKLSEMSIKASLTFDGKYLSQTADIDMQGAEIEPICKDASAKLQFMGVYDGNGHTIDNLKIQSVGFYTEEDVTGTAVVGQVNPRSPKSYNWGGLFATVGETGVVRNLVMGKGCELDFFQNGGAIAGGLYGKIINCSNYADVRTYYINAGGMAGQMFKGSSIEGCYNAGTISVNSSVGGGIVGLATTANISSCENTGAIKGENFNPYQKPETQKTVGGIAGKITNGTEMTDVANSGEIVSFTEVGGIVGNATGTAALPVSVSNALNYGYVTANTSILSLGAISGASTYTTYNNCVTDSRLQHTGLVANGAIKGASALPTAELAGNKTLFPADNWIVEENAYPMVRLAATPAQVALNSKAIITWTGNDYSQAMVGNATLSAGQTWSVIGSNAFSVNADKLNVTIPATGVAEATLTATASGLTRNFYLKSFQYDVFDGDGTATSPFIIATADDFLNLANMVNSTGFNYSGFYFTQTADLDFKGKKFEPVGTSGASFGGIYKGDSHIMKGVDYNNPTTDKTIIQGGLFGIVDFTGEISDLTLDETSVIATYTNGGGITGILYGRISGCVNKGTISTYGTTGAAGIAAYAYPGARIEGCSNSGAITAKSNYAGGILGQALANAGILVTDCTNEGAVKGVTKNGGIIGSASALISRCKNSGEVTSTTSYAAGIIGEALATSSLDSCSNSGAITTPQYLAGIVAMSTAHTEEAPLNITACSNTADITAGAKGYVGGLGGSLNSFVNFTDCYNTGNLTGSATTTGGMRLGGIVSSSGKNTTFVRCHNTGNISGYSNSGGLVGASSDNTLMTDCYNTGNVSGGYTTATNVGGLVGNGPIILTRCYNTGDIEGAGYQVGGLNGTNTTSKNPIVDCFNTGNVKGATKVGGLIGMGRGLLDGCVNYGTVTATNEAGGIIGVPGNAAAASFLVTIDNCLSLGKVECDGANKAAIVAENTSCKYIELKNNYFDSSILSATAKDNVYGDAVKGLTPAQLSETKVSDAFRNETACYPMLKSITDNGVYNYWSALLLLADGEKANDVMSPMKIGTPGLVEWSAEGPIRIEGNEVKFVEITTSAPKADENHYAASLTKTFGELKTIYELLVNPTALGLEKLTMDEDALSVSYYTLDGRQVAGPQAGEVTIRRAVLSDGTTRITKIISR